MNYATGAAINLAELFINITIIYFAIFMINQI